jgi:hypothetical protein
MCKIKRVKFTIEQAIKAQRGSRYSSTLSLILVLYLGGLSIIDPGLFTPKNDSVSTVYIRLGELQSGEMQKILPPPGFYIWTIQPIAGCHTYYATQHMAKHVMRMKLRNTVQ